MSTNQHAALHARLDTWVNDHFAEETQFLQEMVRVPTDTPPGNNAPHAERAATLLADFGFKAETHPVPEAEVRAAGLESVTNLIVRRRFGDGPTIALNAHGDVVPPGEGWTKPPYGGVIEDGKLYGRAAAVSKCDFATFTFALRALEALDVPLAGTVELHFTYDEEFGGDVGPGWLLSHGLTKPDYVISAGFSYQVVTAHNGCLQLEVNVQGKMSHAAIPHTGIDALQGATAILNALYAENTRYQGISSEVKGINHPYLNVGLISGGTNTNVVPGRVTFKLDRRMIPEENPAEVEATLRDIIEKTAATVPGLKVDVRRMLLAHALTPTPAIAPLATALQNNAGEVFGEAIPQIGSPLYTDARLYAQAGAGVVLYGAGPRTVLESNAKRADENVVLEDVRRATQVIARSLLDLLVK